MCPISDPVGEFDSSLNLLRELAGIGHQFEHVGVAAYPEGHPDFGIDGFYLFSFNQVGDTAAWREDMLSRLV